MAPTWAGPGLFELKMQNASIIFYCQLHACVTILQAVNLFTRVVDTSC